MASNPGDIATGGVAQPSSQAGGGFSNDSDAQGRRARLRPKPKAAVDIYGTSGLLQPLRATNGMFWPYQPVIQYTQNVEYQAIDLVHVNQEIYAYTRTNALKFSVSGQFTVQNQQEGLYALASIHFLRTVTKMYFGVGGSAAAQAGTPPPVLLFDAYGKYMFNQLPVIINSFTIELPNDIDYVPVDLANIPTYTQAQTRYNLPGFSNTQKTPQLTSYVNTANSTLMVTRMFRNDLTGRDGYVWLPAVFTVTVEMTVQNSPAKLREFDLNAFRTGVLMKQGRWI